MIASLLTSTFKVLSVNSDTALSFNDKPTRYGQKDTLERINDMTNILLRVSDCLSLWLSV